MKLDWFALSERLAPLHVEFSAIAAFVGAFPMLWAKANRKIDQVLGDDSE